MSEGAWRTVRLGDIADVQSGGTPLVSNKPYWVGNIPWYSSGELNNLYTVAPERHISDAGLEGSNAKLFPEGSLLIGMYDTAALKMSVLDRAAAFNQAIAGVRPNNHIDLIFILHAINSNRELILGQRRGVRQKNLSLGKIKDIELSLPPLPEQQRIVALLDEAFEGIAMAKANAEKNLKNARELFESHLQAVFTQQGEGWVEKRLNELSKINYGYTESASSEVVGPKFLRITDIQNNAVDWDTVPYCNIEHKAFLKFQLSDGDIVFARTGATTGKSYLVTEPPEAVFASYLIRLQLNEKDLLPGFVNLYFNTQTYWDSVRSGVSGSAQGGFNASKLGELKIPFPQSVSEQRAIVGKMDSISAETQRLESIYQQKLAALDELKKSLLHKAFNGEL